MGELIEFPSKPPELEGLSQEELRFYRLIEEREDDGGGERVTLACGHTVWVVGLAESLRYMACAKCFERWIATEKAIHSSEPI